MKCDRETSHHCAAPISLFPPFWSPKKALGLWSVQGQRGGILGRQNAGSSPCEMLITLSPALQLSLSAPDCEWLSHCGALNHFPKAATGTKGGSSCRFKKDVFSTACETAVRIIFLFSPHLRCDRIASREQCCQSIRLSLHEVKKGSLLSVRLDSFSACPKFSLYTPRVGEFKK